MSTPEFATVTDDDLVTGEAVALDLPPAGLGVRLASGLIDAIVTASLLFVVVLVLTIAAIQTDEALVTVAIIGALILVFLVFPTTLETLTRGKTLGKMAFGLRTVRDDAGPITFQHVFVRHLIGVVEIYAFTGAPAFFSMLLSRRGKRLGDFAAGTYVVRERVRLQLAPPGTDATAARVLGTRCRHPTAADGPRSGRPPVPGPAAYPRPPIRAPRSPAVWPPRSRPTSPPTHHPARRPRHTLPPWSPPAGSETKRDSTARLS